MYFRWLAIRLEFIGNFILFFAAFFGVIARGDVESGLVGLSITVALEVSDVCSKLFIYYLFVIYFLVN